MAKTKRSHGEFARPDEGARDFVVYDKTAESASASSKIKQEEAPPAPPVPRRVSQNKMPTAPRAIPPAPCCHATSCCRAPGWRAGTDCKAEIFAHAWSSTPAVCSALPAWNWSFSLSYMLGGVPSVDFSGSCKGWSGLYSPLEGNI